MGCMLGRTPLLVGKLSHACLERTHDSLCANHGHV